MSLKAWREKQKVHQDIAYLVVLAEKEATQDRKVWSFDHLGEPLSGQGLLYGGSS